MIQKRLSESGYEALVEVDRFEIEANELGSERLSMQRHELKGCTSRGGAGHPDQSRLGPP